MYKEVLYEVGTMWRRLHGVNVECAQENVVIHSSKEEMEQHGDTTKDGTARRWKINDSKDKLVICNICTIL